MRAMEDHPGSCSPPPVLRHEYEEEIGTHWLFMHESPRQCFTPHLIRAMRSAFTAIAAATHDQSLTHAVLRSDRVGVFSHGGDLHLFADAIEHGDRECLRRYALEAIDLVRWGEETDGAPVCTIALVEGDVLAGGLEAARSCHLLVAERSARFGLPESGFGLFPGMGAYALVSHYAGIAWAERMIVSGARFTAEEMHKAGIVDVLVEDGQGEAAVRSIIADRRKRSAAVLSVRALRRARPPIESEHLQRNADLWVESAMALDHTALRRMRRLASPAPGSVPSPGSNATGSMPNRGTHREADA